MYTIVLIFQGLMFIAAGPTSPSPDEFWAFFVDPTAVVLGNSNEPLSITQHVPTVTVVGSRFVDPNGSFFVVGNDHLTLELSPPLLEQGEGPPLEVVTKKRNYNQKPLSFREVRSDFEWVTSLGRLLEDDTGTLDAKKLDPGIFKTPYSVAEPKFSGRFFIDRGIVETHLLWGEPDNSNTNPLEVDLYDFGQLSDEMFRDLPGDVKGFAVARAVAVSLEVSGDVKLKRAPLDGDSESSEIAIAGRAGDVVYVIFSNDPISHTTHTGMDSHFLSYFNFVADPSGLKGPFPIPRPAGLGDGDGACSPIRP